MSALDRAVLAERAARVERHLRRVATKLEELGDAPLEPESDASDAITLHLWQAVQTVIDLAVSACVRSGLGAPSTYGAAFRELARVKILEPELAERLVRAAGFRNTVAHGYDTLDLALVRAAAENGPADLRACLAALVTLTGS